MTAWSQLLTIGKGQKNKNGGKGKSLRPGVHNFTSICYSNLRTIHSGDGTNLHQPVRSTSVFLATDHVEF